MAPQLEGITGLRIETHSLAQLGFDASHAKRTRSAASKNDSSEINPHEQAHRAAAGLVVPLRRLLLHLNACRPSPMPSSNPDSRDSNQYFRQ
jgi:hypothetical protein